MLSRLSLVLKAIMSLTFLVMNKERNILQILQNKIVTRIHEHRSVLRYKIRRGQPTNFRKRMPRNNLFEIRIGDFGMLSSVHVNRLI